MISTLVEGYRWLHIWHEQQANPPHLPTQAILVFQNFKRAYDSKNVDKLGLLVSKTYRGNVYGAHSKDEFLAIQYCAFQQLPWGVYPCLRINVYSIIEDTATTFAAIIDTQSIATVVGMPLFSYDAAPMRCRLVVEEGLWLISELFVEPRLQVR